METLKGEVEQTSEKRGSARKRSSGKRGRKKFPVPSKKFFLWYIVSRRKITKSGRSGKFVGKKPRRRQCGLQIEMMGLEAQLAQMKEEIRGWGESLLPVNTAAEAQRELLVNIRNALMYNLLVMEATEASLMHQLGFL